MTKWEDILFPKYDSELRSLLNKAHTSAKYMGLDFNEQDLFIDNYGDAPTEEVPKPRRPAERMSDLSAEAIKCQTNIVWTIGQTVVLRKKGKSWWGLCPFHNEKTPSFSVSEDKQLYHCFGCGVGGDVIKFVQEYAKCSFREALERLSGNK